VVNSVAKVHNVQQVKGSIFAADIIFNSNDKVMSIQNLEDGQVHQDSIGLY
jgi:hypothetical protein